MVSRHFRLSFPSGMQVPDSVGYAIFPGRLPIEDIALMYTKKKFIYGLAHHVQRSVYKFSLRFDRGSAAFKGYDLATVVVHFKDRASGREFYDHFYIAPTRVKKEPEKVTIEEKPALPEGFGFNFIKKYSKNVTAEPNWRSTDSFVTLLEKDSSDWRLAFKFAKAQVKDYAVFVSVASGESFVHYVACDQSRDGKLWYVPFSALAKGLPSGFSSGSYILNFVVLPKSEQAYDVDKELFFQQYAFTVLAPVSQPATFSLVALSPVVERRIVRKRLRKSEEFVVARSDLDSAWMQFAVTSKEPLYLFWKSSATGDVIHSFDNVENPYLFDHFDVFSEFDAVTLTVYLAASAADLTNSQTFMIHITHEPKVKLGESELAAEPEVTTAPAELSPEPAVSADPYADIFAGKEDVNFSGDVGDDWFR